jgi:endonuclease/exonuclease/phosphatase family metal-dependent hydrolase
VDNNLICLIDLPDEIASNNLVIFNAHTPAGNRDEERDAEHDRIAATWRDMLNGNDRPFAIDPNDAVILCGDFNMVGYRRQLESLRDGDIYDNVFGPDFAPGRKEGSLVSAPLRHTHSRLTYTWRQDRASYAPGKLDYILFSSDAATLKRNFALWTPDMPEEVLSGHGLLSDDSPTASDHLPLVADFDFR